MIQKGEPWERPSDADIPPPLVLGSDHDLAAAVAAGGRELRFEPTAASDLGRALGLAPRRAGGGAASVVDVDLIRVGEGEVAVSSIVLGTPPHRLRWWHRSWPVRIAVDGRDLEVERTTTVVVVNGGWLAGHDVVPRAHPGDGWLDVQVYSVARGQRREMHRRLRTGSHLPHPGIVTRRARAVTVELGRARPCTIDGANAGERDRVDVDVRAGALRLHLGGAP